MRVIARITATVLLALLVPVLATSPASAEKVTITDPRGNAEGNSYDIASLTVDHRPDRVRIALISDATPYIYFIRTDVPGARSWDYMTIWSSYYPAFTLVKTRKQWQSGSDESVCRMRNAFEGTGVVRLKMMRSCLGSPSQVRMKALAWDDERGVVDQTGWTPWAGRA